MRFTVPVTVSYQLDMFMDYAALEREKRIQRAMMDIRKRFGENAVIKGMYLMESLKTDPIIEGIREEYEG